MRSSSGIYALSVIDFHKLSEVDLLAHYPSGEIPKRSDYVRLRIVELRVNNVLFAMSDVLPPLMISIRYDNNSLFLTCDCHFSGHHLCSHEMLALSALLHVNAYRPFFDIMARKEALVNTARAFGLEHEQDLDLYFDLRYNNEGVVAVAKNDQILAIDEKKNEIPLVNASLVRKENRDKENKSPQLPILVITRHRFYNQLRFELIKAELSRTGTLKGSVNYLNPASLLWKAKDATEAKFYAAIGSFQQSYNEDEQIDLEALSAIVENPLGLPVYYHDRLISEKISSKSIKPTTIALFQAKIELSVFKRLPFYEIKAFCIWDQQKIVLRNLDLQHQSFVRKDNTFFLIQDSNILNLIHFFKNKAEILLIHHSKYDSFVKNTLGPLEEIVRVNYTYIRQATELETKSIRSDQERIIYFSQEGSYVNITPVVRYGHIEVPISSQKQIRVQDENGNLFTLERQSDFEDKFVNLILLQHQDFREQLTEPDYFYLHHHQFLDDDWFMKAFEAWRNEGITLLGFQELGLTKLNPYRAKIDIKIVSGTDWFNTKINVSFADQQASIKQIHRAIRYKSKYIQLDDGTLGILPEDWLQKITAFFQFSILEGDLLKTPKICISAIESLFEKEIVPYEIEEEIKTIRQTLAKIKVLKNTAVPKGLTTRLRSYQIEGLQWLNQLDDLNFGGCLADDMGLGKTIQMIAYLLSQREKRGKCIDLIVVPTSLVFNWQNEIKSFAPALNVLLWTGMERKKKMEELMPYDIILTSYGTLLSDIALLKKIDFNSIILDESQAIKNPNSERYKASRLLQSRVRFVLTGTPVENSTFDLYGQLSFACPGLLGSRQFFKDTYATPIDRFQDRQRAKSLQKTIAPFVLRRTKQQVASELPEKTEMLIYCEMGSEQRKIYDVHEAELRAYLTNTNEEEINRNNMHVLSALTRLRQICNAPFLLKEGYDAHISTKIDTLLEHLDGLISDHKILIFSQFVSMLDLIKQALVKRNIPFCLLTGDTKDRESVVQEFQEDSSKHVFLISLKAGGVGLNLTAADYVFLVDPWWNPAIENQAIDRCYRIGQDKHVVAVRLITPNTVEEKIRDLQEKKKELAYDMVKTDTDVMSKFSKRDWLDLLS
ncbi:DEAD/DEAH box helicase [Sphingobacterium sp. LRF_L2]|uniref:DEAD/DEAH box helicase n=1 Tax=Sphingobacterium sp. LRF_L2 TaxID=3369421 RepID=UPI003F633C8C